MGQLVGVLVAILLGAGGALQVGFLGSMSRSRGSIEATVLSILGTITFLSLVLAVQTLRGHALGLPAPFTSWLLFAGVALGAGSFLAVGLAGLPLYLAITGALAVPYLIGASYLTPRLGVGLFLGSIITGQLLAGVIMDHVGAFGVPARPIDVVRMLGVVALLGGVILIRGFR